MTNHNIVIGRARGGLSVPGSDYTPCFFRLEGASSPPHPPDLAPRATVKKEGVLQLRPTQNKDTDNFVSSAHTHPPATSSTHLPLFKLHHPKGTKCQANCLNLVDLGRSCEHTACAEQRESYHNRHNGNNLLGSCRQI